MKKYTIKYSDDFWQDLQKVIDWYDELSNQVCDNFLQQLWLTESRILINPLAFRKVNKHFRRALIKRFNQTIYYRIVENEIFVIGLIHVKRSNKFVKRRLK